MCLCVCPSVCMCTTYRCQKKLQVLWNSTYRRLEAAVWVLGVELRASVRATGALDYWAIFIPAFFFSFKKGRTNTKTVGSGEVGSFFEVPMSKHENLSSDPRIHPWHSSRHLQPQICGVHWLASLSSLWLSGLVKDLVSKNEGGEGKTPNSQYTCTCPHCQVYTPYTHANNIINITTTIKSYSVYLCKSNWEGVVAQACNSSTWEMESGGAEVLDWTTRWLCGQRHLPLNFKDLSLIP